MNCTGSKYIVYNCEKISMKIVSEHTLLLQSVWILSISIFILRFIVLLCALIVHAFLLPNGMALS